MLSKIKPENILFLDIETVPEFEHFNDLSKIKQKLAQIPHFSYI
jgi:hypothetical protein